MPNIREMAAINTSNPSPGWAELGSALAGGGEVGGEMAADKGMALGASTANAMQEAMTRRQKNEAVLKLQDPEYQKELGLTPVQGKRYAVAVATGMNPADLANMLKTDQETSYRSGIANLDNSPEQRAALGAAIDPGNLTKPFQDLGNGTYASTTSPQQGVQVSPVGQSEVDKNTAAANLDTGKLANPGAFFEGSGGKAATVQPYQWARNPDGSQQLDANGNPVAVATTGGPKDPNAPASLGARGLIYLQRSLTGGAEATADLKSALALPVGASSGILGTGYGSTPGHSIMASTVDNLRQKVQPEDNQMYNATLPGMNRGLGMLEGSGLAPTGAYTNSFDGLTITPSDTENTRLWKYAGARQGMEAAYSVILNNPNVPQTLQDKAKQQLADLKTAIPWTRADVIALKNSPSGTTIGDVVNARTAKEAADAANPATADQPTAATNNSAPTTMAQITGAAAPEPPTNPPVAKPSAAAVAAAAAATRTPNNPNVNPAALPPVPGSVPNNPNDTAPAGPAVAAMAPAVAAGATAGAAHAGTAPPLPAIDPMVLAAMKKYPVPQPVAQAQ